MNDSLRQDINRFFSVFQNNVEYDLKRLLPPNTAVLDFYSEFQEELDSFHSSVMKRLSE